MIDRIEECAGVARDQSRTDAERVEAADEVLLWAGRDLARAAVRRALLGRN